MNTVWIVDPEEWQRVLAARPRSPLYVSSDIMWFIDGRGTKFLSPRVQG